MNIMENKEQSNQAVVEDNGGPVRGHFEASRDRLIERMPKIQEPTFEQALEIVKRRMMEVRTGKVAGVSLSFLQSANSVEWYVVSEGRDHAFDESLEAAIAILPEPKSKAELLRAEIAAKQSELERLEGRVG